jgi:hypothetical protein
MKKTLARHAIIAALALLVGFGIARRIYQQSPSGADIGGTQRKTEGGTAVKSGLGELDFFPPRSSFKESADTPLAHTLRILDQRPGERVAIDALTIGENVWIAVHEDAAGKPGNILGAARFRQGTYENGVVELLRPTFGGDRYYAMLHADDGDDVFDLTKDTPMTDAAGNILMVLFDAIGSPSQRQ